MTVKQHYFESVDLVNKFREEIEDLQKEYEENFIYEQKAEAISKKIIIRKNSIRHLEEMMMGIREEVGRETMRKWKKEYMEKGRS